MSKHGKTAGPVEVPTQVLAEKEAGLITINVPQQLICEHGFQVFVDRNGSIRGYQIVDLHLELKKVTDETRNLPRGNFSLKLILVGDNSVGKTSLIQRFGENTYKDNYLATLGVDITKKIIHLTEDCQVALILWDIAGQRSIFEQHRTRLYSEDQRVFHRI